MQQPAPRGAGRCNFSVFNTMQWVRHLIDNHNDSVPALDSSDLWDRRVE